MSKSELDIADRQTIAASLDQEAQDVEARTVAEFGEHCCGGIDLHAVTYSAAAAERNHFFGYMVLRPAMWLSSRGMMAPSAGEQAELVTHAIRISS